MRSPEVEGLLCGLVRDGLYLLCAGGRLRGWLFDGLQVDVGLLCFYVQSSSSVLFLRLMAYDLDLDLLVAEVIINQIVLLRLALLVDLHRAVDEVDQVERDGRTSDHQGVQQSNEEAEGACETEDGEQDVDLALDAVHEGVGAGVEAVAEDRQGAAKEDLQRRYAELLRAEDKGRKQRVATIDEELELQVDYLKLRLVFDL